MGESRIPAFAGMTGRGVEIGQGNKHNTIIP